MAWYHEKYYDAVNDIRLASLNDNIHVYVDEDKGVLTCPLCGKDELKRFTSGQVNRIHRRIDQNDWFRPMMLTANSDEQGRQKFSDDEMKSGIFYCKKSKAHDGLHFPATRAAYVDDGTEVDIHKNIYAHPPVVTNALPRGIEDQYYIENRGLAHCPQCGNDQLIPIKERDYRRAVGFGLAEDSENIITDPNQDKTQYYLKCKNSEGHESGYHHLFNLDNASYSQVDNPDDYNKYGNLPRYKKKESSKKWYG